MLISGFSSRKRASATFQTPAILAIHARVRSRSVPVYEGTVRFVSAPPIPSFCSRLLQFTSTYVIVRAASLNVVRCARDFENEQ